MESKNGLSPEEVTKSQKLKSFMKLSREALSCNLSTDEDKVMKANYLRAVAEKYSKSKNNKK